MADVAVSRSAGPILSAGLAFSAGLAALEALAEATRLRLASLLASHELTVTELTTILGQSQPRVSRHLKLMVDAGLIERNREGAWAFYRLADSAGVRRLVSEALSLIDAADATLSADTARLAEVLGDRSKAAAAYFAAHAADWNRIRALHVAEGEVERALVATIGDRPVEAILDLGTGTGRMLELLAGRAARAVGVDASPAMLAVARANLERAGLRNVQLRQGDIYALPVERNGYDLVIVHQVLHYLNDPGRALREASRTLRPGGRLVIVDFAPHDHEFLREKHAHRRLGFTAEEVKSLLEDCGLDVLSHHDLAPGGSAAGEKLTVSLWVARDRRQWNDMLLTPRLEEIA